MHQDNADMVNRGWDAMQVILDKEMPVEKKRRKGFFFFLTGIGSIAVLLLLVYVIRQDATFDKGAIASSSTTAKIETTNIETSQPQTTTFVDAKEAAETISKNEIDNESPNNTTNTKPVNNNITSTSQLKSVPSTVTSSSTKPVDLEPANRVSDGIVSKPDTSPSTASGNNNNQINNVVTASPSKVLKETFQPGETSIPDGTVSTETRSNATNKQTTAQALAKDALADDTNTNTFPDLKPAANISSNNTFPQASLEAANIVSLQIPLLESKRITLQIPNSYLPMSLPIVVKIKEPAFNPSTTLGIGIAGSYLLKSDGYGYESFASINRQISSSFSIGYRLGYGRIHFNEPNDARAVLAAAAPSSDTSTGIEADLPTGGNADTLDEPSGPEGAAGPEGANPFEEMQPLEISETQLKQLSVVSLQRVNAISNELHLSWHPSRKISFSPIAGADYLFGNKFRSLYVINESSYSNDLTSDQRSQNQVREVDLALSKKWLFNTGIFVSYRLTQKINLSVGYKHYLSSFIDQDSANSLNQAKVGLSFLF